MNEEKEKSENSVDNTLVSSGTAKTMETTHVPASFTLQLITFCEDINKVDTSPITISSPVKEKTNVFANP